MPATRLVLPLAILAGALFFAPPAPGDHSAPASTSESGKQANSKPPPKNSKPEQPVTKKESRMNERDREMDKRMKQQKAR